MHYEHKKFNKNQIRSAETKGVIITSLMLGIVYAIIACFIMQ